MKQSLKYNYFIMIVFIILVTFLYRESLWELFIFSEYNNIYNGLYSYIFFIPVISCYFIFQKRNIIFRNKNTQRRQFNFFISLFFFILGTLPFFLKENLFDLLNKNDYLFTQTIGFVFCIIGSFAFAFGANAVKEAVFPLGLLVGMAPIPLFILEKYIHFLQHLSVNTSYFLLKVLNVPVFRQDTLLQLPNFTMEIAEECSGIRSSIVLCFTGLCTGYIFLKSNFMRVVLLIAINPIAVFKNSLRIVTLGILASYIDPIYITNHWLHSTGGILFFIITLIFIFFPFVFFLRILEKKYILKMDKNEDKR